MNPQDFFTISSISGLAAAAAAVNVTANAIYKIGRIDPKKTAFVAALIIAYFNVFVKTEPYWAEWLLAFINGCLLFCTAMGMNDMLQQSSPVKRGLFPDSTSATEPFFRSWWRSGVH